MTTLTTPDHNAPGITRIADVDGDGKPDIITTTTGGVNVFYNNGNGTFTSGTTISMTDPNTGDWQHAYQTVDSVVVGDFNGDGKPDIAVVFNEETTPRDLTGLPSGCTGANIAYCNEGAVAVRLGNGNRSFASSTLVFSQVHWHSEDGQARWDTKPLLDVALFPSGGGGSAGLVIGAASDYDGPLLYVLKGNGDGSFSSTTSSAYTGRGTSTAHTGYHQVLVGDVNSDGLPDVVAVDPENGSAIVGVFYNNGDGTVIEADSSVEPQMQGGHAQDLGRAALIDVNGDHLLDLVGTTEDGTPTYKNVSTWLGNGAGFSQTPASTAGSGPFTPTGSSYLAQTFAADFNRDGDPDVIVVSNQGTTPQSAIGQADGSFSSINALSSGSSLVLGGDTGDLNGDGLPDFVVGDAAGGTSNYPSVHVYLNNVSTTTPIGGAAGNFETRGFDNPSEHLYTCPCGKPVNPVTGALDDTYNLISVPGRGIPLSFSLNYNSLGAAGSTTQGPVGMGWRDNLGMSLSIDGTTGIVTVIQENGSTVAFTPTSSGAHTYYTPPRVLANLTYCTGAHTPIALCQAASTYLFQRRTTGEYFIFSSTSPYQIQSATDRNGYVTSYTYVSGQLTTVQEDSRAGGRKLALSYDTDTPPNLTGVQLKTTGGTALSPSVTLTYTGTGPYELASIATNDLDTGLSARTWTFSYDESAYVTAPATGNHLITTVVSPRFTGGSTKLHNYYNASDQVTQQVDNLGRTMSFSYSTGSTTITAPGNDGVTNRVVQINYSNGLITSRIEDPGSSPHVNATWTYLNDPAIGAPDKITDPNGHSTSMTYDVNGNVATSTDALGRITTTVWNAFGEPASVTDPSGVSTTTVYDANGNKTLVSRWLAGTSSSSVTRFTYGDPGHPGDVTAVTDPMDAATTMTYDAYGNLASTTDPLGDTTTATYKAQGWRLTSTTPRGNQQGALPGRYTTSWMYDGFGEATSVTDPLHHTTTQTYDAEGNVMKSTDADGNVTTNAYDADNEKTDVYRPDDTHSGGSGSDDWQTSYNGDGTVRTQVDGSGHTTIYGHNSLGQTVSVEDPDLRTTSSSYDSVGNLLTVTDPSSNVTTYKYDAANQQCWYFFGISSNSCLSPPTGAVTSIYDQLGRRTAMSDAAGSESWQWDSLGRLTTSTDGNGATICYAYDLRGDLTQLTYLPGTNCASSPASTYHTVTRGFDAAGRLTTVQDWAGNTITMAYDADSNLVSTTFPTSGTAVVDSATFDNADRLTGLSDAKGATTIASFGYTRDPNNQVTNDQQSQGASSETFGYDAVSRLTSQGGNSYAYDTADNLTSNKGTTQNYDAANQLNYVGASTTACNSSPPTGSTSFCYDTRGDRLSSVQNVSGTLTTSTYTYDQASRLASFTKAGGTATECTAPSGAGPTSYCYNGDGLRLKKQTSTTTIQYAWDVSGGLPLVLRDGPSGSQASYVYGPGGLPIELITSAGTVYAVHHDQLGSTRAVTDSSGTVQATWNYDAYGNVTSSTGSVPMPLQFAGQYTDAESGLQYLRARYYDPTTGQFLTRDPSVTTTLCPYGYVSGNPVNSRDVTGLAKQLLGFGATSAGGYWTETYDTVSNITTVTATSTFGRFQMELAPNGVYLWQWVTTDPAFDASNCGAIVGTSWSSSSADGLASLGCQSTVFGASGFGKTAMTGPEVTFVIALGAPWLRPPGSPGSITISGTITNPNVAGAFGNGGYGEVAYEACAPSMHFT
jgi:RHS repeat-associated protein